MTTTPHTILKDTFGYDDFLPRQKDVIENILQRRDTLAIMPTGGGKSLCYQIPALLLQGVTIVVSPLIALMKDQIDQLRQLGIPAVTLNSSLVAREYFHNTEQIRNGMTRLIYMAPETLLTGKISNLIKEVQIDLLVIDEAHCISEWGHDFRPEYREIIKVRREMPGVTCLALTATATDRVRKDIKKSLGFEDHNEFISSFDRKNLVIEIIPKENADEQAVDMINQFPGRPGIIYCFSRKQVDLLAAELKRRRISALPYHAGLSDDERRRNQEAFIHDDANIIVATVAFGMGINKPDVRYVLHYDLPKSLEGYYQEIGRAGRDGQRSICRLLFSYGDKNKIQYILRTKSGKERAAAEEQFDALLKYIDTPGCRRKPLLAYFGETYREPSCEMCDWCLASQEKVMDITIPAQKFMSCVKRSGETFGAVHITDILIGQQTEKVLHHNHQNLSTFGIGKDWSRSQWLSLADQLQSLNLLEKSGPYNTLKLTEAASDALRTRCTITAVKPRLQPALFNARPTIPAKQPVRIKQKERMPEADNRLYELLRSLRKTIADREHIPPYAIFADRTLVEMAAYHPQTPSSLKQMHGVGSVKGERFGNSFLNAIILFCREHGLNEIHKRAASRSGSVPVESTRKPKFIEVAEEFSAGKSVDDLCTKYNIQMQTVIGYFVKYVKTGRSIPDPERLLKFSRVSPAIRYQVMRSFDDLGTEYLKPVFKKLNETVDFNELRILQLYYLNTRNQKAAK